MISSVPIPMIVEQEDRMTLRMSDREGVDGETGFVVIGGVPFVNLVDGSRAFPPTRDGDDDDVVLRTRATREGAVKTAPFTTVSERRYESSEMTASESL